MFGYSPAQVRKALVAAAGFAVTVLTTILATDADLISPRWLPWVHVVIGVAGFYGVFRVPNTPPGPVPPIGDVSPARRDVGATVVEVILIVLGVVFLVWLLARLL
jgi:hypothetical protein